MGGDVGAGKKKQKIVEGVNVTDNDIDDPDNIDGVDGLKGGASEKLRLAKPMAVVTDVRNTGWKFTRRLSTIASRLAMPFCIDTSAVTRMCMESATATVRMMVGAPEEGGSIVYR